MNRKIVITGATGLIGKKIFSKLLKRGDEIIVFTRSVDNAKKIIPGAAKYVCWNLKSIDWLKEIEGVDAAIHLAGENLMAARWTKKHKEEVRKSRILSNKLFVDAFAALKNKPRVFVAASAVGYYGNSETEVDETSPRGSGFLAELVKDWENETSRINEYGIRSVSVRTGIVLDKNEGALAKMLLPFKFYIGGPLGNGKQWMPWIHADDLANIFLLAIENENIKGPINGVSPNPVSMNEFAKTLGRVINRPAFFRVPSFVLKIVLGEAAQTVLTGAKVNPNKVLKVGYNFNYETLEIALKEILKK
jgi:hypothetical protein